MKPFTFMTVALMLLFGFLLLAGRTTVVVCDAASPTLVGAHHVPARPPMIDDEDDDDREEVEGLPVPIVPGTRATEAEASPPKGMKPRAGRPRSPSLLRKAAPPVVTTTTREISGRLSATEDRARNDARLQLEREVTEWLTPEVPTSWKPPVSLVKSMIRRTEVNPIVKPYGTVYEATLEADFSSMSRDRLLGAYRRQVVSQRLMVLAGSLGFVMACLAALAGYIRADEATQGYYTQWLRAVAAAGVGASGIVIYQLLT